MITHQHYYFVAIHLLVDHQLSLQTKYKQLKCISVLNFNMSIKALTGLLTGLKEFNLLIPWPYTGTNVVVELYWKSRKNKKNDKQYLVTNIVLQYCYTISVFDFPNILIFKVYLVCRVRKTTFNFAGNIKIDFCCDTFAWFLFSTAYKRYFCQFFSVTCPYQAWAWKFCS